PEMKVCFLTDDNDDNGRAVRVGVTQAADTLRQVTDGIARADLQNPPFDGQLLLGNQPGAVNQLALPRQKLSGDDLNGLYNAFLPLVRTGERRVWVLYSPGLDSPLPSGEVGIIGFVAAQVMDVQLDEQAGKLCAVIQPGMRITRTAVTDASRRTGGLRTV